MRTCRNKALTRLALAASDVRQPRFTIVCADDEIDAALESIGLPCVVKPADDTGSNLVRLCYTDQEVIDQSRHILALETNVRGQSTAHTVLVEEFLDAPEYSVEMFSWAGNTTCVGVTEKHLLGLPYFVEHRHIFPARLPREVEAQMQSTVAQALAAVGVTTGATHTEVKLTPAGCAIVEINARLAGGMIPELVRYATGVDLLEQQLRVALGQAPTLRPSRQAWAGIQFIVANAAGMLLAVEGVDAARESVGIAEVKITVPGDTMVAPPRNAYDRLGYLIAHGPSYSEAVARLDQATAQIHLLLEQTSVTA
jgi:biotin carboxylase